MLSFIRDHTQSIVVKILAVLLIGSFAVWGVEDMFNVVTSESAAIYEVGDIEGDPNLIEKDVQREINRLRPLFGDKLDFEQAKALGLVEMVLQRQINDGAILQASQNLGVAISDDLITKEIRQTDIFQTAGRFDRNRFRQILSNSLMSEAGYIASTRMVLSRNHLLDSVSSETAPRVYVDSVYRYRQEKRTAETVFVSDSLQQGIPEPSDDDLKKFHKKNASRFTAPEYRAVTVIRLDAADLAAEISVSEKDIKETYEAHEDEFTKKELRQVKQMILADEKDAQKAAKALSQGRDFAVVAKEIAGMDATTIDLGSISKEHLPFPELADAVFALELGKNSAPLKSALGWHLFRVEGLKPGGVKSLDEVRDDLRKTIAHDKAIDSLFELANKLEDTLGSGATLEDAAGQLNVKVHKIAAVDKTGKGIDGKTLKGLPGGDFLGIAFATEEGSDSPLSETGEEGYFVLRVDGVSAPALKPLNSIRAEIVKAWKEDKRANKSKAAAEALVARVKAGATLASIAADTGLEIKTTPPLLRQPEKEQDGIPQALVSKIFALSKGQAAMARSKAGYTIASLKDITAADPGQDKKGVDDLSGQLVQSIRNDLHAQLAEALRNRYGVTINRDAVAGLFTGAARGRRR
ncbi:MAG: peptidyl-prolyl cis-trans isomerase [Rhodospirillales bacterium]|nr:peptidyl-prolyl cis-trans isomerase [Alphaproteobacteria bacterium]MBL6947819.1 peptidyl-prolyl cis-trans isomerase [Rhodospirillales bacterium]